MKLVHWPLTGELLVTFGTARRRLGGAVVYSHLIDKWLKIFRPNEVDVNYLYTPTSPFIL